MPVEEDLRAKRHAKRSKMMQHNENDKAGQEQQPVHRLWRLFVCNSFPALARMAIDFDLTLGAEDMEAVEKRLADPVVPNILKLYLVIELIQNKKYYTGKESHQMVIITKSLTEVMILRIVSTHRFGYLLFYL